MVIASGRLLVATLALLAALVSAQGVGPIEDRTLDDIVESGFIEIAVYRDFPPYSYQDSAGNPLGLDIEVGKLIAKGLGVEPHWYWVVPDETLEDDLRNAVWKGSLFDGSRADLMLRVPYDRDYAYAIDGYGLPKHEHVVFFGPYHQEGWAIARDLEKTGDVRNLAIFAYEKIGVEIDSLPDTMLLSAFNGRLRENVTHYPKVADALTGLNQGEVAAVVGMRSQIEWGLRGDTRGFDVDTDGLEQLAKLHWDIGAAVKENHRQLSYAVESVLDAAIKSGEMAKVFAELSVTYSRPSVYESEE